MPRWELLAGAIAFVAAFWQQANRFLAWIRGWVIVSRKTDWGTGLLMLSYMEATMRTSVPRDAGYGSSIAFVRPLDRVYRVVYQSLRGARQTFWRGVRPVWYTPVSSDNNKAGPGRDLQMDFSFLRGTYDWEKLMTDAAAWEDATKHGLGKQTTRFRVHYHYGSLGSMGELVLATSGGANFKNSRGEPPVLSTESEWNGPTCGVRLLEWSLEDVQGAPVLATIDNLSLRPELLSLVEELKFWHTSQQWYQKHGVPWRRGCLLHGGPGTGKTSFARAVAELLDLPVHIFDLAGMSNQDLKRAWREMMTMSPCIALLEDLDAVFEGRKNVAPQSGMASGVTFDTLLNCIDGIERVDGMLLVVTTNNLDRLDTALTDRPGRIDSVVEFKSLDHDGRVKMATRILDSVELAIQLAVEGKDDSAAKFQERCFRVALQRHYTERVSSRENSGFIAFQKAMKP